MNNEKKIAFQSKRIAELEKQVKCLEAENKSMENDIDRYKKILLSNDDTIKSLRLEISEYKKHYDAEMCEIIELKNNLKNLILEAMASRSKFEKEMKYLIGRIRKGK